MNSMTQSFLPEITMNIVCNEDSEIFPTELVKQLSCDFDANDINNNNIYFMTSWQFSWHSFPQSDKTNVMGVALQSSLSSSRSLERRVGKESAETSCSWGLSD